MNLYKSTLATNTRIYQHTSNVITCTRYVRTKERPKKDYVLIFNHLLHLRYFFLFCEKHFTALHIILAAFFAPKYRDYHYHKSVHSISVNRHFCKYMYKYIVQAVAAIGGGECLIERFDGVAKMRA